jgi:hypothetical protein
VKIGDRMSPAVLAARHSITLAPGNLAYDMFLSLSLSLVLSLSLSLSLSRSLSLSPSHATTTTTTTVANQAATID